MAEDEGFEPSRLSSTRVRDARTRPLCESSGAILTAANEIVHAQVWFQDLLISAPASELAKKLGSRFRLVDFFHPIRVQPLHASPFRFSEEKYLHPKGVISYLISTSSINVTRVLFFNKVSAWLS